MTDKLPPLPQAVDVTPQSWSNLYSADQMRAYAEEAVRLEREAIFEEVCKVSDGVFMMLHANGITSAEHQSVQSAISVIRNTIRARSAAIRARSEVAPDPAER